MPAIQVDLSAYVIMKLSSFMILPHLLFFVILPRLFGPVNIFGIGGAKFQIQMGFSRCPPLFDVNARGPL